MVSALAVVALALGIGLSTLMFSILNGAVLRGLPFERSERILHASPFDIKENDDFAATQWEFAEWRTRQTSFEDLTAFYLGNANVVGPDGTPERYRGAWITANTFRMLRTRPVLGRDFADADGQPGAEPVVIISDRVWRDRFQGRTDVLGQPLRVNGTAMTVVGVMPPKFAYPIVQELWVALVVDPALEGKDQRTPVEIIGRLRDDRSRDEASAELATIAAQVAQLDPKRRDGITVEVKPYVDEFIGSETVGLLSMMLAAVLLVLVIACVNVANLVLARAADRTREVAVRTALGARRAQVVRQTLAEVLVLAAVGAVLGTAIAAFGAETFNRYIVDTIPPFWIDVRIDGTVLLFVTGGHRAGGARGRARAGAPRLARRRAAAAERRGPRHHQPEDWPALARTGRRRDGVVVRPARRFRPGPAEHRQRDQLRPGIRHPRGAHRAAQPARRRVSRRPQPHPLRRLAARTAARPARRGARGNQHQQSAIGGRDERGAAGPVVPGRTGLPAIEGHQSSRTASSR